MGGVVKVLVLLLVVGTVQTRLTAVWAPLSVFDPLMVATGILALRLPFAPAVLTGAAAGLIQDSLGGGIVGLHAFSKTLVAASLASMGTFLVVRGEVASSIVIGVAAVAESLIARGLLLFFGWPVGESTAWVLGRGAGALFLSVISTPLRLASGRAGGPSPPGRPRRPPREGP